MDYPLVSINVLSYNSHLFVAETLESIKNQTYQNIELIISDDASTDGTYTICKNWLEQNKSRFFLESKVLTVEKNTGVTANSIRALNNSHGIYWKPIGSDDILIPNAIEQFVNYMQNNSSAKFVFGKQISFKGDFIERNFCKCELEFRALCFRDSVTAYRQFRFLLRHFIGCAPASFGETEVLRQVGGFDERYPMNEDGPLYLRLTKNGIKLNYLDEFVVYRRIHQNSIMHKKEEISLIPNIMILNAKGPQSASYEYQSSFWRAMSRFSHRLTMNVIRTGNNKHSFKCRFWNYIRKWANPYKWDLIIAKIQDKFLSFIGF